MPSPFHLCSDNSQLGLTKVHESTMVDVVTQATELAESAGSKDPSVGLKAVASLRRLLEGLERLQVENARDQGWSWEAIAMELGVSKQAVHKKYARSRRVSRRGRTRSV
jgi:hypothetical protein